MYHNPTLFPAVARIIELISASNDIASQIQPRLINLKDELQGLPLKENIVETFNQQDIPNTANEDINANERRVLAEVRETMTNQEALSFLEKIQNESHLTIDKLKQLAVVLAGKCEIPVLNSQLKTLENVFRWFDLNWDHIQPYATDILIVNCDSK